MAPAPGVNFELKARDPSPRHTLAAARAVGAEDLGFFDQRDTFFWVPSGRLKLREQEGGAEQIHYQRADLPEPRPSSYQRLPVADADGLKEVLAEHLGTVAVVEKRRRLLVKDNVRIHLDEVQGLGSFLELEAVTPLGTRPENQLVRINALRRALGVTDDLLVAGAYADCLAGEQDP